MKIAYVIPSLFRESLNDTIASIKEEDTNASIFVVGNLVSDPSATANNRNLALKAIKGENYDWVVFVDDDDVLLPGYSKQLDPAFELVVLRMSCNGEIIPKMSDNNLYECNVGINLAINLNRVKNIPKFDNTQHHEDWFFIQDLLDFNDIKYKVTKEVFYLAKSKGNKKA